MFRLVSFMCKSAPCIPCVLRVIPHVWPRGHFATREPLAYPACSTSKLYSTNVPFSDGPDREKSRLETSFLNVLFGSPCTGVTSHVNHCYAFHSIYPLI